MGRTKIDNVEIDDDAAPRKSHKLLATIADPPGGELAILRDNMTFGRPGAGEPPDAYDRLLDFSTAVSGTTFFVPTAPMPEALATAPDAGGASSSSLRIGSLRR